MAIQPDFSKSAFNDRPHRPRLSSHPATEHSRSSQDYDPFQDDHMAPEDVCSPLSSKGASYKTCCTCSGLGMVEVNNGVGGYFTIYCEDCEAGIELEAQDAMAEALWDRQMAGEAV